MLPILNDILRLTPRMSRLEHWVAANQRNPQEVNTANATHDTGLSGEIAALQRELDILWNDLISYSQANPPTNHQGRNELLEAASKLIALMRRLQEVHKQHAAASGLPPPPQPETSLHAIAPRDALAALATVPDYKAIAEARRILDLKGLRISLKIAGLIGIAEARRFLGLKQTGIFWKIAGIIGIVVVLFFLLFSYFNRPSRSAQGGVATNVPQLPASAAASGTSPASPEEETANAAAPTAPQTNDGTTSTNNATEVGPATTSSQPADTSIPTTQESHTVAPEPTAVPATVAPTSAPPTPEPPKPAPTRKPPPTSPPAPKKRTFVADIRKTFPNLPDSGQRKSCVNGQVFDRRGGVSGAIVQINNGISTSEPKSTNGSGYFEFCGLGSSKWSVVLEYVPSPLLARGVVAVVEVSGQEGQFAQVNFREP